MYFVLAQAAQLYSGPHIILIGKLINVQGMIIKITQVFI